MGELPIAEIRTLIERWRSYEIANYSNDYTYGYGSALHGAAQDLVNLLNKAGHTL